MTHTNWNHDQPAVVFLRKQITLYFPEVAFHWAAMTNTDPKHHGPRVYETHPLHGVGGFKARSTEFGNPSLHASGRAADIYVKIQNPLLKAIGDSLFDGFVANGPNLGLDQVIWNRQIWSAAHPVIAPYHGKEHHEDHMHVGFTIHGSQLQPAVLIDVLKQARNKVDDQFL